MSLVGISYGVVAFGFAVLCVLALTSWRGNELGLRFLSVCLSMVVWAVAVIIADSVKPEPFLLVFVPEVVRDVAILWAIFGIAGASIPKFLKWLTYSGALLLLLLGIGRNSIEHLGLTEVGAEQLLARSGLLFAFLGLVSLEQTFRNARAAVRQSLRFVVLGFGIILVYDLFLYSQVELFHNVREDEWMARGWVTALAVPMLAIAMRRNPQWSLDIFVSRQVVFHTTAFLAVGVYLLFVAVGAYYVRIFGGTWGGIAQIFFFSGALIVLISIMFSQAMRRRVKVFIAKHFYSNKYDYRVEWLRFVQTLSTDATMDIRSNAIHAIAQTIGSPSGMLFMADDSGRRFVPTAGWPHAVTIDGLKETNTSEEFVRILGERQWIIDLEEYRQSPDVYQNIALPKWLEQHPTARIVSPILELNRLEGFLLLDESTPPFKLTYEDRDLLKTLGRHVATYLAQHEASGKLAESRQFEAYNRLTAFMMHDLKNSVAQLKLIVTNAARHKNNPEFIDDTIVTIANAADRMTRLIEQLRSNSQDTATRRVEINELATLAVKRCADRTPAPTVKVATESALVRADRERLQAVIEHVIRNAQDATAVDGEINVGVECDADRVRVLVADSGHGMDAQFVRDRLFKPFDSTKGSKGMGIGAYQVREYVRSLGGEVEVRSSPGSGTLFSLTFQRFTDGPTAAA